MSASPQRLTLEHVAHVAHAALRRILLVDDEAHVLRALRLGLHRSGYEVDTALDDEVALRLARERDYVAMVTSDEFAPAGRGLCDSVRLSLGERAPLMFVMIDAAPGAHRANGRWGEAGAGVERLERPVSLRRIVARLDEHLLARADGWR